MPEGIARCVQPPPPREVPQAPAVSSALVVEVPAADAQVSRRTLAKRKRFPVTLPPIPPEIEPAVQRLVEKHAHAGQHLRRDRTSSRLRQRILDAREQLQPDSRTTLSAVLVKIAELMQAETHAVSLRDREEILNRINAALTLREIPSRSVQNIAESLTEIYQDNVVVCLDKQVESNYRFGSEHFPERRKLAATLLVMKSLLEKRELCQITHQIRVEQGQELFALIEQSAVLAELPPEADRLLVLAQNTAQTKGSRANLQCAFKELVRKRRAYFHDLQNTADLQATPEANTFAEREYALRSLVIAAKQLPNIEREELNREIAINVAALMEEMPVSYSFRSFGVHLIKAGTLESDAFSNANSLNVTRAILTDKTKTVDAEEMMLIVTALDAGQLAFDQECRLALKSELVEWHKRDSAGFKQFSSKVELTGILRRAHNLKVLDFTIHEVTGQKQIIAQNGSITKKKRTSRKPRNPTLLSPQNLAQLLAAIDKQIPPTEAPCVNAPDASEGRESSADTSAIFEEGSGASEDLDLASLADVAIAAATEARELRVLENSQTLRTMQDQVLEIQQALNEKTKQLVQMQMQLQLQPRITLKDLVLNFEETAAKIVANPEWSEDAESSAQIQALRLRVLQHASNDEYKSGVYVAFAESLLSDKSATLLHACFNTAQEREELILHFVGNTDLTEALASNTNRLLALLHRHCTNEAIHGEGYTEKTFTALRDKTALYLHHDSSAEKIPYDRRIALTIELLENAYHSGRSIFDNIDNTEKAALLHACINLAAEERSDGTINLRALTQVFSGTHEMITPQSPEIRARLFKASAKDFDKLPSMRAKRRAINFVLTELEAGTKTTDTSLYDRLLKQIGPLDLPSVNSEDRPSLAFMRRVDALIGFGCFPAKRTAYLTTASLIQKRNSEFLPDPNDRAMLELMELLA